VTCGAYLPLCVTPENQPVKNEKNDVAPISGDEQSHMQDDEVATSTATVVDWWPLRNIIEPHNHDVIFDSLPPFFFHLSTRIPSDDPVECHGNRHDESESSDDEEVLGNETKHQSEKRFHCHERSAVPEESRNLMHVGNSRFLQLVDRHRERYNAASKMEKSIRAIEVVREWRQGQSPAGRFLQYDNEKRLWYDIGDGKALGKTSAVLKNKLLFENVRRNRSNGSSTTTATTKTSLTEIDEVSTVTPVGTPKKESSLNCDDENKQEMPALRVPMLFPSTLADSCDAKETKATDFHPNVRHGSDESRLAHKKGILETGTVSVGIGNGLLIPTNDGILHRVISGHGHDGNVNRFNTTHSSLQSANQNIERRGWDFASESQNQIFGRDLEHKQLREAYERVHGRSNSSHHQNNGFTNELVLVSGEAGIGKSSLVSSALFQRDGGYYLTGKFERMVPKANVSLPSESSPSPLQVETTHYVGAMHSLLLDFAKQVQGRGPIEITRIRDRIDNWRGDSFQEGGNGLGTDRWLASWTILLSNFVPELQVILSRTIDGVNQHPGQQARGGATRLRQAICALFQAVVSHKYPLVIVLDDLHWADSTSLDQFEALIDCSFSTEKHLVSKHEHSQCGILFVGTHRNDDGSTAISDTWKARCSEGMFDLETTHKSCQNFNVTKIRLLALDETELNIFIAKLLASEPETTTVLATAVFQRTKGNLLHTLEYLRELKDIGSLLFDKVARSWRWNIEEVYVNDSFSSNVDSLICAKLCKLPDVTLDVVKIAACFGSRVEQELLNMATGTTVHDILLFATSLGFLAYHLEDGVYAFTHDRVQEAAYSLINEAERNAFHLRIGRKLWKKLEGEKVDQYVMVVARQLLAGVGAMSDPREKMVLASILLRSGEAAVLQSDFAAAYSYLMNGVSLVDGDWNNEYSLHLLLFSSAAEVAYCNGRFGEVDSLVSTILQNSRCFEDNLRAYASRVYRLGSSGRTIEAVDSGVSVLLELGVEFQRNPTISIVNKALHRIISRLSKRSNESVLRLPRMTDPKKLAAMQMMNLIFMYTFVTKVELACLIGFEMVSMTLDFGISGPSSLGFVVVAMALCGWRQDIELGYEYGRLGMRIIEQYDTRVWTGRVFAGFYSCVFGWKKPPCAAFEPLRYAHRVGLECGDIEFAFLNANILCWLQIEYTPLPVLEREMITYRTKMKIYNQFLLMQANQPTLQWVNSMQGRFSGSDITKLFGEFITDETEVEALRKTNPRAFLWIQLYRMTLAYLFGDYDQAPKYSRNCGTTMEHPFFGPDCSFVLLLEALCHIQLARNQGLRRMPLALRRLKQLKKWSLHNPSLFLGKVALLEAELATLAICSPILAMTKYGSGVGVPKINPRRYCVHSKYISAIALSREAGFLLQTALACERLGKFLLEDNFDPESAVHYIREALKLYSEWGGIAKVQHLEREMQHYF
jgi:predicted ATPase